MGSLVVNLILHPVTLSLVLTFCDCWWICNHVTMLVQALCFGLSSNFYLYLNSQNNHHLVWGKYGFSLFLPLSGLVSVCGTDVGCSGFFLSFLHPSPCFLPPFSVLVCLGALLLIRVFAPSWQHMQLNSSMCYSSVSFISLCYPTKYILQLSSICCYINSWSHLPLFLP